ncbi:DUF6705 family protein [Chryseobacterium sp. GP-SGM7]|uniref:DUF6705 family protein n=1 Tax=Chryseobacterium sp. GP-SGM7 TaxID=3411323 RepID=UPI003B9629ED
MKNIIYLLSIICCISFNNCSAQNIVQHILDPSSDKFTGMWKWGGATNGVTLIMKKEYNVHLLGNNDNTIADVIIGFHKINKNGQITEDHTIFSNTNFADKKNSFVGMTDIHTPNPNELRIWMSHKNKNIELEILYIDLTHIKIVGVKNQEGARFIKPGQAPTDWSIDIPNNIILTKQ